MTYVLMYEASNILLLKSNYHESQMGRSLLVDAMLPVQKLLHTYSGTTSLIPDSDFVSQTQPRGYVGIRPVSANRLKGSTNGSHPLVAIFIFMSVPKLLSSVEWIDFSTDMTEITDYCTRFTSFNRKALRDSAGSATCTRSVSDRRDPIRFS